MEIGEVSYFDSNMKIGPEENEIIVYQKWQEETQ